MFKNPGRSLKTYGKIVFVIFVIAAIAGGISMFATAGNMGRYSGGAAFGMVIGGIVVIAVGIFLAYLMSIFVIAFGELVENSTVIRTLMENGATMPRVQQGESKNQPVQQAQFKPYTPPAKTVNLNKDSDTALICSNCGVDNKLEASFCRNCGKKLS